MGENQSRHKWMWLIWIVFSGVTARKKKKFSETCSSKVSGQNVKFIVIAPPFGQIATNLTLQFLGSSTMHLPTMKSVG